MFRRDFKDVSRQKKNSNRKIYENDFDLHKLEEHDGIDFLTWCW